MKDFLTFRRMITPIVIQVLFWIALAAYLIAGFVLIVRGASADHLGSLQVLLGTAFLIFGPVVARIECELLVVAFRINESLTDIAKNTEGLRGRVLRAPTPQQGVQPSPQGPTQ